MASKANILKKVHGLIARSSSDSKEEARTSAFMACKLIREHDLRVTLPNGVGPEVPRRADGASWWEDYIDRGGDAVAEAVRAEAVRVDPFRHGADVHIQRARYGGLCKHCKGTISVGDQIAFISRGKRKGAYHEKCAGGDTNSVP